MDGLKSCWKLVTAGWVGGLVCCISYISILRKESEKHAKNKQDLGGFKMLEKPCFFSLGGWG